MMDAQAILNDTSHRPMPLPQGHWIMEQGWYRLLFAHWRADARQLRSLLPPELELDLFEGKGWVSTTSFLLRMRPRGMGLAGTLWAFPELNCRTYARYQGQPGVFFFSLDAASMPAVLGARTFFRVPYFHSEMEIREEDSGTRFISRRQGSGAVYDATYKPVGEIHIAEAGSLEQWLVERYCFFTVVGGRVWRADIHHKPWPLQNAQASFSANTVLRSAGLPIDGPPAVTSYAERQEVLIWRLRKAQAQALAA